MPRPTAVSGLPAPCARRTAKDVFDRPADVVAKGPGCGAETTWTTSFVAVLALYWDRTARVRLLLEATMANLKWTYRWKNWITPTKLPGVWQRRDGGHLVRSRVVDPTTGAMKEVKKVLPEMDAASAYKWLQEELQRIRAGAAACPKPLQVRFSEFSASLFERKVAVKEIKSAKGKERWGYTLRHLIKGTDGETEEGRMHVAGFGDFFLDQLRASHIEAWKVGVARLIAAGVYSPTTTNGWLSILKVILKTAKRELELPSNPALEIAMFDTSEHHPYTDEEPNSLLVEEVRMFLEAMLQLYPQHYAMTYVGFCLGLRPSSLRPLRRRGATPDILWDEGAVLVRRSQTRGDEVMNTTKTGKRQRIGVPSEMTDTLRWHEANMLLTPEQQGSDLMFPSITGGYRAPSVLDKPFAAVSREIGLTKHFTPRGLRRTFQDLARAASVESLIQKSISGHATDAMKDHYSTVSPHEQRAGIGRVIGLLRRGSNSEDNSGAPGGAPTPGGGAPEE